MVRFTNNLAMPGFQHTVRHHVETAGNVDGLAKAMEDVGDMDRRVEGTSTVGLASPVLDH